MMQNMPVIPEGSENAQRRLSRLLVRVAHTQTGKKMLVHIARMADRPLRLGISASMCRTRNSLGFFSEPNHAVFIDDGNEGEQLATLAHELGHAALSLSGFSRENMHHPVGDMVLLKWHESLVSGLSAQIVWEDGGEDSPAWQVLKKEDPRATAAFAWQARLNPASVENGTAMAAAAEALLEDPAFMAGLEASSMALCKDKWEGWASQDALRQSLGRVLEDLPFVLPALRARLMMETTHVRPHPKGQVAAFLDKVGWPQDSLREISFPGKASQPVPSSRLASVFHSVAGWLGRGDATCKVDRSDSRKYGRRRP
ncbi:MAG: hypothetical protein A2018_00305 [Alphaproteobacteria bacterium GWF2_58_20]|nr:MAG: hypothetical protein A2018_00305 [Alphaproteobacteria bacterium GWF2_58_20]